MRIIEKNNFYKKKESFMKKSLLGVLTIGVLGLSATGVSAASNMNAPAQPNTKEAITKRVEERFSKYKDTDRLLPVDGGYLDGTMTEAVELNGKIVPGTEKKIDSHADISKTKTVAEIKQLEISYAEKGISSGVSKNSSLSTRFLNVPSQTKFLDPAQTYTSGSFNGGFLEFAGYWFKNKSGINSQGWRVYGDSGLVGDMNDAWTTYNTAGVNTQGYLLNPSSAYTAIFATDGGTSLTFYTFHPAAGSGYSVMGR